MRYAWYERILGLGADEATSQAHGMLPYLGAGAGMAIDDGYTLGRLLGDCANGGKTIPLASVLKAYESLRGPLTREMHAHSFASAEALELGGEYEALRDQEVGKGTPDLLLLLEKLGESTAEEHMWAAGRCAP